MDHLPDFGGAPRIRVPYLGATMYDGGDFHTYPQRAGFDQDKLWNNDLHGRSVLDAAAFLQTWMYFGLLHQVFGPANVSFDPLDFLIESNSGDKFITTRKLSKYVAKWYELEQPKSAEDKRKRFEIIKPCLDKVYQLTSRYCQPYRGEVVKHNQTDYLIHQQLEFALRQYRQELDRRSTIAGTTITGSKTVLLPSDISLSILVLADTLTKAGFEITGQKFNIDWGGSYFLVQLMTQAGWCPRAVATCVKGQQIHNLYYASTLGSPPVQKDHQGCDEKVCKWEQVDIKTYSTQHRQECAGCEFKGPKKEEYIAMFKAGRTPVLCWKAVGGSHQLILSDTTQVEAYVAISHVWGDGLGNQHENKLPVCQLHHLQVLVDKMRQDAGITSEGCFWWCDTICVPVGEEYKSFRKTEIRNMRRIYQDAARVLALDSTLLGISKDSYIVELYIRLKLSSWARRLWTLQEAKLARDVHIQFSNGTRTISDLARSITDEGRRENQYLYTRYSFLAKTFFTPFTQATSQAPSIQLAGVWRQLQWRATSHASDEAVCLAAVLGLDPGPVLEVPPEDHEGRMARLLHLLGSIPLLLIVQPPPRLSREGFGWAPTSFLNCFRETATNPFQGLPGFGMIGPDGKGLRLSRAGLEILREKDPLPKIGTDLVISHVKEGNAESSLVSYQYGSDRAKVSSNGSMLLLQPVIVHLDLEARRGHQAILAEITDRGGAVMKVKFLAIVRLVAADTTAQDTGEEKTAVYQTREYPSGQQWLIY